MYFPYSNWRISIAISVSPELLSHQFWGKENPASKTSSCRFQWCQKSRRSWRKIEPARVPYRRQEVRQNLSASLPIQVFKNHGSLKLSILQGNQAWYKSMGYLWMHFHWILHWFGLGILWTRKCQPLTCWRFMWWFFVATPKKNRRNVAGGWWYDDMGVSLNGGIPKTPQNDHF